MNIIRTVSVLILVTMFASGSAIAEGVKLSEKLANSDVSVTIDMPNCKEDAEILCPGLSKDSRKSMMCLMAYEDNLSIDCKIGVIEAVLIYEMGMLDINYSINACEADADKHCLNVKPGAGRIVSCLRENKNKISERCTSALKETGMWNLGAK
ncbi:MAG: cysteine rich repeat-containing protein [Proteobacteria bacterium]|nr:cysteine rich repeat-containing protein [Pseudomonadota bacterium]